jgi:hypothetical protein
MKISHRNTFNIPEDDLDIEIYRVMPIQRLLEILSNKKLVLVSPDKWDDPFENLLLKSLASLPSGGVVDLIRQKNNSVYGQCWTLHKETDAMWRIYSADKQGVKVKTTVRKLLDVAINSQPQPNSNLYLLGLVEYPRTQKELIKKLKSLLSQRTGERNIAESLLYKRHEFNHEKEVRLIYTGSDSASSIHSIDVDPFELFEEIVFDPRLNRHIYEAYAKAVADSGFRKSVRQSVMYRPPPSLFGELEKILS